VAQSLENKKFKNQGTNRYQASQYLQAVRVIDVILDINHPEAKKNGGYDAIGTIFYSKIYEKDSADITKVKDKARPLFHFLKQYPLKNEIVLILNAPSNVIYGETQSITKYYFPNINIWNHPHNNALPDMQYHAEGNKKGNLSTAEGALVRDPENNPIEVPLGDYFNENLNLQPLLPFEGDTIMEGRFGNSIRFGGTAKEAREKTSYSTKGETGDPITIIRNGQHLEEDDRGWEHTLENINTDHSSIYLTSNQVLPNLEIVSTHWQSWMAKHDELDVGKAKNDFDNITKANEAEVIELEKPPENDNEFNEASDEELSKEPNSNDEPISDTIKIGLVEAQEGDITVETKKEGHPVHHGEEEVPVDVNSEGQVSPRDDTISEDPLPTPSTPSDTSSTETEEEIPDIQDDPKTADFGPETTDKETYAPRGKEFIIEFTQGRRDGIYTWYYDMKEKSPPWPAGSAEEFVQLGSLSSDGSSTDIDSIKYGIDEAYEEWDDGYTMENPY
jgi:hypothetical protein|tara:strand:+ start:474 stop:1982 length:1509 start_codon:yes stop_codon:yes gene_type:complete